MGDFRACSLHGCLKNCPEFAPKEHNSNCNSVIPVVTPDMELFWILFARFFSEIRMTSLKPHVKSVSKVLRKMSDSRTSYISSVTISASANNFQSWKSLKKLYLMPSCLMNVYENYGQKWPPEGATVQGGWGGWPTGNGKKLSSCQAQLGQATCLAVA